MWLKINSFVVVWFGILSGYLYNIYVRTISITTTFKI